MKRVFFVFCFLLAATFLFADTINWQNVMTDKNPKSKANVELVKEIVRNINYYADDMRFGKISFSDVIEKIMGNNITCTINGDNIFGLQTNAYVFGYKNINKLVELNDANIRKKIPLYIHESNKQDIPSFYTINIWGKSVYFAKRMDEGKLIEDFSIEE